MIFSGAFIAQAPAKGMLKVYLRSQYEDILVPRSKDILPRKWCGIRFEQINAFEGLLQQNGTHILKFYMSVSPEKQLERLNERITNPEKHWKHNDVIGIPCLPTGTLPGCISEDLRPLLRSPGISYLLITTGRKHG